MNDRLKELVKGAKHAVEQEGILLDLALEKFAELIVRECIEQAHSVADLRGVNDDMIYGADTAAARIAKHFGVNNETK